jgi:hypothetical protein
MISPLVIFVVLKTPNPWMGLFPILIFVGGLISIVEVNIIKIKVFINICKS